MAVWGAERPQLGPGGSRREGAPQEYLIKSGKFKTTTPTDKYALTMNRALEIVMTHGTGRNSPYSKLGVAGKTGTSNDNRDSWFAGFDNTLSWVIWVGRDDNKPTGLTGSSGALQVWNRLVTKQGVDPIQRLDENYLVELEFLTGLVANSRCADTVSVPITKRTTLPVKQGCGIKQKRYRSRYRD